MKPTVRYWRMNYRFDGRHCEDLSALVAYNRIISAEPTLIRDEEASDALAGRVISRYGLQS